MAAKHILRGDNSRQALLNGIDELAEPVVSTLGPKSANVAIERPWGAPVVIHDGVSVAKEINLKDPFENMGVELIKQAAEKTNDKAGDGTTTATLLTQAIAKRGNKFILAGSSPMILREGIQKATEIVINQLKTIAKPVKNEAEIKQVARVSAQNKEIGDAVTEAMDKVGKDGVITVEEGKGTDISISYTEGMEYDKGYASAYFATDADTMEAEIKDPYIVVTDKKLSTQADVLPFMEAFVTLGYKDLVIIAQLIEGDALGFLVLNKIKAGLNILAVQGPSFGDKQKAMLEDIAALTGATFISEDAGDKLDGKEVDGICGHADLVVAGKDFTRIVGGKPDQEALEARTELLRNGIEKANSEFEAEQLRERLAKLTAGVAIINVGAATEAELKELKERVKDAVSATKAAIEEGLVPGGGVALLRAREELRDMIIAGEFTGDAKFGAQMVYDALEMPIHRILTNSNEKADVVIYKIMESKNVNYGYDVMTQTYGDMYKKGVIDPVKVTRLALENASSVAGSVLTTESLVSDIPAPEPSR